MARRVDEGRDTEGGRGGVARGARARARGRVAGVRRVSIQLPRISSGRGDSPPRICHLRGRDCPRISGVPGAFFEILRQYIPAYSFARPTDWEKRSGEKERACLHQHPPDESRVISRYRAISFKVSLRDENAAIAKLSTIT